MTSNPHADDGTHRSGDRYADEATDGKEATDVKGANDADVELYEDDGNVVLFDAANPLAWVEATRTVRLTDAA